MIVPPIQPDNPNKGEPSDHSIPVAVPLKTGFKVRSLDSIYYRTITRAPRKKNDFDFLRAKKKKCLTPFKTKAPFEPKCKM